MTRNSQLNANQEITRWLDSAGKYPRLPTHVVNAIGKQIQSLPEDSLKRKRLVSKLVQHNLLLVANFVKKFMDRSSHNAWGSTETLDYLQVATLGLIRAAEKFDPLRGYAFSTYASFWMRSTVGRYNIKTITPVHVSEAATRRLIYYKRNGKFSKNDQAKGCSTKRINELEQELALAYQCVSLDIEMDSGSGLVEAIPGQAPEESHTLESIFDSIKASGVDEDSLTVLRLNFIERKTVKQISKIMKIKEEKVSSMRRAALERASRHPELF